MRPRKFAAGIGGLLEHLEGGLLARVLWEGEGVSYPFLWLDGHYRFAKLGAAVFPDLSGYVE